MLDIHPRSRGTRCPSFSNRPPSKPRGRRECRMRVAPEAACATKSTRVSNHRYTASAGIPCAMVLTVSFALSPVTGLFCHRHFAGHVPQSLAPAAGRQDHTTSPSAATSFVRALFTHLTLPRPSHPAPNVRDDREPPLLRERDNRLNNAVS